MLKVSKKIRGCAAESFSTAEFNLILFAFHLFCVLPQRCTKSTSCPVAECLEAEPSSMQQALLSLAHLFTIKAVFQPWNLYCLSHECGLSSSFIEKHRNKQLRKQTFDDFHKTCSSRLHRRTCTYNPTWFSSSHFCLKKIKSLFCFLPLLPLSVLTVFPLGSQV